ncbi:hypothetical protein FRB98_000821 [Tulasnella sp. 332]|nr:hypothetical protein FRB98_000821 [Tulasnella sp. 332]
MFDPAYRIWLIKYLIIVFSPTVAFYYFLSNTLGSGNEGSGFGKFFYLSACLITTPFVWFIFGRMRDWRDSVNASKLGARLPPLLKGKRFDNADLIAKWAKGMLEGYVANVVDELLDDIGTDTARLSVLGVDRIITRDPDVVKYVLSTAFSDFQRPQLLFSRSFFGKGIFGSNGDRAKMHRSLARPYFSRERISDYEIFQKYTDKMIGGLKHATDSGEAVDVQDMFSRFTMDAAGEFLFGTSELNTLDLPFTKAAEAVLGPKGIATEGYYGSFVKAFEQSQLNTRKRFGKPVQVWTILEFFHDIQTDSTNAIQDFLDPLIKKALENKARRAAGKMNADEEVLSFLDHLALSSDDVGLVRDQLLNMLLAARDTTANVLAFTCYLLSMHPDVLEQLRQEVLANFGHTGLPTYDNMKSLVYLRAVLNETMRLFPPVPFSFRVPKSSTVIPTRSGPLFIPRADWQIMYSVPSIHRRKDLWGEDADDFIPSRWLGSRGKGVSELPQFIPFSAGPRVCLGQEFAWNQMSFVMVRLLQVIDGLILAQDEAPAGSLPPGDWKLGQGRQAIEKIHPMSAMTMYSKLFLNAVIVL